MVRFREKLIYYQVYDFASHKLTSDSGCAVELLNSSPLKLLLKVACTSLVELGGKVKKYRGLKAQHFTNRIKLIDIIRQIVQLQFHNDLILNSLIENYSWLMQIAY